MKPTSSAKTEAEIFGAYCGLTCLGGSEARECRCDGPNDCEMRTDPRFSHWRFKAEERMRRYLMNGIGGDHG